MLAETVREAARRFPDVVAFVDPDGSRLTFAGLDTGSDLVASRLRAGGVSEGDVVALDLPSDSRYVLAYVGLAKLGAVTAGLSPRLAHAEREALIGLAGPHLVLDEEQVAALLATSAGGDPGEPPPLPYDPDRIVAIVFTSGTTGTPKGAVFTGRELEAVTAADTGGRWADGSSSHMLASTQFAHVGFMTKLPWYLRLATMTHILARWTAADALSVIAEHRIRSVGGVAPQVALMLRDPAFDRLDLSCVETIVMGGAFSPPELVREARRRFGAAYSIRYSSTESGGVGTATAFDADDEEALHTVGRPRPGVELEVRHEDGSRCAPGEVGEIVLRSGCVMRGYWRDPEATAVTLRDGWLHTGDLGVLDERGLLRLAGRRTEMYVRGGYNVFPAEVEAALAGHPAVAEVAVAPRPDPVMGEIGVAFVVCRSGAMAPSLDELRSHAADLLSSHKLPEDLVVVDGLPLTAMHKIDRNALRLMAGGRARR